MDSAYFGDTTYITKPIAPVLMHSGSNPGHISEIQTGKASIHTAHSLNPVPFIIYDKDNSWTIPYGNCGLANVVLLL